MYRVIGGPPASASSGTLYNTINSAGSCTPNLLPPGARSDDERFGSSVGRIVQETGKVGDNGGPNTTTTTSTTGIFGRGARREDNGRLVTIFLVVNYITGSGILNTPQTFRDSGLAATTVLYFVTCLTIWFGVVVLVKAAEALSIRDGQKDGGGGTVLGDLDYTELARRTLGKYGPSMVDGVMAVQLTGGACSYVLLIGGLATSVIGECAGGATGVWWQSFYFVTPTMFLLFVLPACLIRHFSNLRWLAPFSLFTIIAVVCLVVVGSPFYAAAERRSENAPIGLDAPLLGWDWTGCFAKTGSVLFSLAVAPSALPSYSGMETRTVKEWKIVAGVSILTGAVLSYCTGIAGYLAFRMATAGDILDNFSGPVAGCFKALVVVHLILYIPNHVVILRHSLYALAGRDVMVASFVSVSAVTIGTMTAVVVAVIALMLAGITQGDLFGYVLDLAGGITGSLTGFVLPALTYLQVTKGMVDQVDVEGGNIRAYRTGCKVLFVFGCIVVVMVPIAVVVDIRRK